MDQSNSSNEIYDLFPELWDDVQFTTTVHRDSYIDQYGNQVQSLPSGAVSGPSDAPVFVAAPGQLSDTAFDPTLGSLNAPEFVAAPGTSQATAFDHSFSLLNAPLPGFWNASLPVQFPVPASIPMPVDVLAPSDAPVPEAPTGPASKSYTIPPRPKPGRKPMKNEDGDRRKLQNRTAQRSFRQRKAQQEDQSKIAMEALKIKHVQQLDSLKLEQSFEIQRRDSEINAKNLQLKEKDAQYQTLQQENVALKARLGESVSLGARLRGGGFGSTYAEPPSEQTVTPPEDDDEPMDFTFDSRFKRRRVDETCGFCNDDRGCICAMGPSDNMPDLELSESVNPPAQPSTSGAAGTCDMCRADPEKARQCRELAQAAQFGSSSSATRILPAPTASSSGNQPSDDRVSCSDFFMKLGPAQRTKLDSEVISRLHAFPYTRTGSTSGNEPAMEFAADDAAIALAQLSAQTVIHK